jgi:hypothetical protein
VHGRYLHDQRLYDGTPVDKTLTVVDPVHQSIKPKPEMGIVPRTFDLHFDSCGRFVQQHVRTEPEAPQRPLSHWHWLRSQWYRIFKLAHSPEFSDHKKIRENRFGEVERLDTAYFHREGDHIPYTKVVRDPARMSDDPADWAEART